MKKLIVITTLILSLATSAIAANKNWLDVFERCGIEPTPDLLQVYDDAIGLYQKALNEGSQGVLFRLRQPRELSEEEINTLLFEWSLEEAEKLVSYSFYRHAIRPSWNNLDPECDNVTEMNETHREILNAHKMAAWYF